MFRGGSSFYCVSLKNSVDKDFRNILLKNYIEHYAYKLYDKLIHKNYLRSLSDYIFIEVVLKTYLDKLYFFISYMTNLCIKVVVV